MSWTNELYKVYTHHKDDQDFLPLYHIQVQAAYEVTLDEKSRFVTAEALEKERAVTLAPVTEDSATRTSGMAAMPFTEKLSYIAGDYNQYADDKNAGEKFELYRKQMERWMGSDFCHPAVGIVYQYVIQKSLIHDLVRCQIFQTDEKTGKQKVDDVFVRFRINYTDKSKTAKTWEDKELQACFIAFNRQAEEKKELCYASGEVVPITYKHPAKILNAGDKAKLISANDDAGFAYRGRFSSKEEAFSVGYEYSNQIHNALSWLIQSKRYVRFGSLYLLIWESEDQPLPDICKPAIDIEDEFEGEDADASTSPGAYSNFKSDLYQMIEGYRQNFDYDAKVMLMGLDETTPGKGRISMSLYTEIAGSRYLENIQYWHETIVAERWYGKKKKSVFNSFSLFEIVNAAFGHEEGGKLACKSEVLDNTILRLVPCVTERRKIPSDIVHHLCAKASRPLAYDKKYNHRLVLEVACGMIRKRNIENHEGVVAVAYDPNERDRSYLYGCLLALANKTEADTYDADDRNSRSTNAQRYWEAFSKRPCQTWKIIEERLQPYLNKAGSYRTYYEKRFNEIMDKMTMDVFSDDSALSPAYLLGYHHYTSYLYKKNNTEEES